MDNSKKYWTDDPERIEKYILNKLSTEEKKRLDAEIADCEPCKAKLRKELDLAVGVRRYGRDSMKARLRKKLRRERATQFFNYQYIGLAAAVVIIAIGLGAYQIWFSDLVAPKRFHQQEIVLKQSLDSANTIVESQSADQKRAASKPQTEQKESDRLSDKSTSVKQKNEITENNTVDKSAPIISNAESNQLSAGAAGKSEAMVSEITSAESSPSAIWLIGQIVVVNELAQERALSTAKNQKRDNATISEQRRSKTNSQSLETITLNKKTKENNIVLQQRSMKDLPIERSQQRTVQQREIETLLERTEDGIQLTLFDDSIKESDMKNAVVERLSDDSIVVSLPNQRIAYRLPSGWNSTSSGHR